MTLETCMYTHDSLENSLGVEEEIASNSDLTRDQKSDSAGEAVDSLRCNLGW